MWHWDRFFFEFFGFPLSISFQLFITWEINNRPDGSRSSETQFHAIDMNNNNNTHNVKVVKGTYYGMCKV
jgi:hypothetical protein